MSFLVLQNLGFLLWPMLVGKNLVTNIHIWNSHCLREDHIPECYSICIAHQGSKTARFPSWKEDGTYQSHFLASGTFLGNNSYNPRLRSVCFWFLRISMLVSPYCWGWSFFAFSSCLKGYTYSSSGDHTEISHAILSLSSIAYTPFPPWRGFEKLFGEPSLQITSN